MIENGLPLSRQIFDTWDKILKSPGTGKGVRRLRILASSGRDLWGFVQSDNEVGVSIELAAEVIKGIASLPSSRSFTVSAERYGERTRVSIQLAHDSWREIFAELCGDVFAWCLRANSDQEIIERVIERLEAWKTLFVSVASGPLSQEKQAGLWGELHMLLMALDKISLERAISCWAGPEDATHDFSFDLTHIEVKSTLKALSNGLKVNSLAQLSLTDASKLFLYVLKLEPGAEGSNTGLSLPALVQDIRVRALDVGAELEGQFDQKLKLAGYFSIHEPIYSNQTFQIETERVLNISEEFPSLTPNNVPSTILSANYTLSIQDLVEFDCEVADIWIALSTESIASDSSLPDAT